MIATFDPYAPHSTDDCAARMAVLTRQVASAETARAAAVDALRARMTADGATYRPAPTVRKSARPDGCAPAKAPAGNHVGCAEHWKVPGFRRPVCIARPGIIRENGLATGEQIAAEVTDRDRALAFALDCARRIPAGYRLPMR